PQGSKDNENKVHFVLSQKDGAPNDNAIIVYDIAREEFEITLEDGTKLYLGGTQNTIRRNTVSTSKIFASSYSDGEQAQVSCYNNKTIEQRQDVPSEWLIRKVLNADYVDGDNDTQNDPLTSPKTNKGDWVVFTYDKNGPFNARRLPYASQTVQNGIYASATVVSSTGRGRDESIAGDVDSYFMSDIYLRSVQSPGGKVVYNYTTNRKDDLWLRSEDFNWNWSNKPADQIVATRDNPRVIERNVLDNIVFYNEGNNPVRTVKFNTSYSLRPGTFYSKIKDISGNWVDNAHNAACLTLDEIQILDRNASNPYFIKFRYDYNPTVMSHGNGYNLPGGPSHVFFQQEARDLWGYFFRKPVSVVNDFNETGEYTKAVQLGITQAAAWSLTSIAFPSGKQITWEYEPHRYDRSNGEPLRIPSSTGPRYGGGIRVKSVTVTDQGAEGDKKQEEYSYFYTDSDLSFVETTTNGSGHATAEPYPYLLSSDDDPRAEIARGGLYTPAKVCYEKVKIVKGYLPPSIQHPEGQTPFGFNVYDYYTSADFKNRGKYGEYDESWRRGFQKRAAQFNSKNICIAEKIQSFEWYSNSWFVTTPAVNNAENAQHIGCGEVRLVSAEQKNNGVRQITNQYFADTYSGFGTDADRKTVSSQAYNYAIVPYTLQSDKSDNYSSIGTCGNFVGSSDPDAFAIVHDRMVTTWTPPTGNHTPVNVPKNSVELLVCWDIPVDPANPSSPVNWRKITIVDMDAVQTNHFTDLQLHINPQNNGTVDVYVSYLDDRSAPRVYWKVPEVHISNGVLVSNAPELVSAAQGTMYNGNVLTIDPTNGLVVRYSKDYTIDRDGKPNKVTTVNSNGKTLIKEVVPAFTQTAYTEMRDKNILLPVCQSTTYGKSSDASAVPYVVAAQATTWSKSLGTSTWVSNKVYTWKADFLADGTADKTFENFNHTAGVANANWKLMGSADKYTPNSQIKESSKPASGTKSLPSATLYGYNGTRPIASITGGTWDECAVFTGDYDDGVDPDYFDKENGWGKGAGNEAGLLNAESRVCEEAKHFGNKGVKVTNAFGPTRAIKLEKGR
ncbi:MAG TPA: hypothetical protein VKO63_03200, partial [Chitinispirillaceae bacterium]|nr:hypothetical protein [Chitinispirillaceae bacterium]